MGEKKKTSRKSNLVSGESRTKRGTFAKGSSGNPNGRKALPPEFKTLAEQHSIEALNAVIGIMRTADKASDRLKAAELVMAYGVGRPTQEMQITGRDGKDLIPELTVMIKGNDGE